MSIPAAIGFRAKTGRAIAVALAEPVASPRLLWRGEIDLTVPKSPATAQPYHRFMELPWEKAVVAVQPLVASIENEANTTIESLLRDLGDGGWRVRAIGVVGSAPRPLEKIGNYHIRAHAAEGMLFRRVLESAARQANVASFGFSEKEVPEAAAATLGDAAYVARRLKILGREAGPPWRSDERSAATAAWLALATKLTVRKLATS
jgi:hypothetical protein